MDVDFPSTSFSSHYSSKPKQIRYVNVEVQTDPVQVFPVPTADIREVVVSEDLKLQNKRLTLYNKTILEQRKRQYAQKLSRTRAKQIDYAMKIAQNIDAPVRSKRKMVRTSGPPGASAPKLSLPAYPQSPSDQLKNLQIEEDRMSRPPTPGAQIPTKNEEQLLASDSEV